MARQPREAVEVRDVEYSIDHDILTFAMSIQSVTHDKARNFMEQFFRHKTAEKYEMFSITTHPIQGKNRRMMVKALVYFPGKLPWWIECTREIIRSLKIEYAVHSKDTIRVLGRLTEEQMYVLSKFDYLMFGEWESKRDPKQSGDLITFRKMPRRQYRYKIER